jgi:anti-sigma factor RsiW
MTCERIEEYLSELIDHQLDPQTAEKVNRHLTDCAACRQEFEELRLIVEQSAALEPLEPPDRLYWTIRNRVRSARPRPWYAPQKVGWVLVPALVTAALMLVVFPGKHSAGRRGTEPVASAGPAMHADTGGSLALAPENPQSTPGSPELRTPRSEIAGAGWTSGRPEIRTPKSEVVSGIPVAVAPVMVAADVAPVAATVKTQRPQENSEVIASLRNVQQALEEIEAALQQNPGNVQVQAAYRVTYQKGMELKQRYVLGAR